MPVAEDVEVDIVIAAVFVGEMVERRFAARERCGDGMIAAAAGRPGAGKTEDPVRRQRLEQSQTGLVAENVEDQLRLGVVGAKRVAADAAVRSLR